MIRTPRNTKTFSIPIVTVVLIGTLAAAPPPELERAETLYFEGETRQARALLKDWLKENPEDPSYLGVAQRYLGFFEEVKALQSELEALLEEQSTPHRRVSLLRWAAETAELMGDYTQARGYFLKGAMAASEPEVALDMELSALEIGLLLGESEETAARIGEILAQEGSSFQLSRRLLILSRALRLGGKDMQSWKIAMETVQKRATPEALLWLSSFQLGETEEGYSDRLKAEYPMSPQARIIQGRDSLKPDPLALGLGESQLDELDAPVESASLKIPSPRSEQSNPSGDNEWGGPTGTIQVGSFLDQDNAIELVKDLKRGGWDADIQPLIQGGKVYHRVQILEIPIADLSEELKKLRQGGFHGFILR